MLGFKNQIDLFFQLYAISCRQKRYFNTDFNTELMILLNP